jgi:excisionase family DNA binding protein
MSTASRSTTRRRSRPSSPVTDVSGVASRRTPGSVTAPVQLPDLMDITAVAGHLGVSVRHVRKLVAQRRIPYIKWGNLLRFDPDSVATWLDQKVVPAQTHVPGGRRSPVQGRSQ